MLDKAVLAIVWDGEQTKTLSSLEQTARILAGERNENESSVSRVRGVWSELRVFEVQFNPASLKFHGHGGVYLAGEENAVSQGQKTEQYTAVSSAELSFELNFEGENTRQQVGAVLGLKIVSKDKEVLFVWGKNSFVGHVSEVSGEYTMFNSKGLPIRGKVNLTLSRIGESREHQERCEEAYRKLAENNNEV